MEERSLEEIDKMVLHAKLEKSDLHPAVQCICFSPTLGNDDFKLLEVDKTVLEDLLSEGSLTIRGLKSDSAVLCTKKMTFEMKEAETSNTLLLLPHCSTDAELPSTSESPIYQKVEAMKQSYFELRPVKPRLKRLRERLEENVYDGNIVDNAHQEKHKHTFDELLEDVQSSEEELRRGLEDIKACLIGGYWRLLDFDYQVQLLTSIIAAVDEHSWSIDHIPFTEVCQQLQDVYPLDVIRHVLGCFATANATSNDGLVYYKLKDDAVSRFYAELILSATPEFNLHDFIETWQMAVPDGMNTDLSQLEGMVLVDREARPEVIRHFPVSELPEDVEERLGTGTVRVQTVTELIARFQELFRAKARWTLEEITPYLEGLCLEKQGIGVLLTKYARVSSQNGIKLYSSKKL